MPNNDYILRSDAKNAITDQWWAEIDRVPAADVKPVRHGRWVKMTGMMPPEFAGHYSCSECDWFCKKHSVRETEFDFCPGCGAKMNEEEEDV